jgi:CRP-like cAMP-binding protein
VLNHSTSKKEVDRALELAATLDVDLGETTDSPVHISYPEITAGWLRRPTLDAEGLRSLPLFASLDDALCERVLLTAREHLAAADEPIVEQWQATRDLFVVMTGKVQVVTDAETPVFLEPGDFFGELAAIDWGAGFGRTRTATVVAVQATRLLVLGWKLVNDLMTIEPTFGRHLEEVARERLARL